MNKKFSILLFIMSMLVLASILLDMKFLHIESLSAQIPRKTTINAPRVQKNNIEIPGALIGRKEQIIRHTGYTVSYNEDWLIPNWVAYELTPQEAYGETPRANDFIPDPDVIGNSATTEDYKGSGFDRGHMAPAADMKWSKQAMDECFYLSNICPQNHNLNGGDWKALEEKIRYWASTGDTLYIVCGPLMAKTKQTIGANKVSVPAAFFKVILRKNANKIAAIAFMMPNRSGHKSLSTYTMSVEDMEIVAEMDFFKALTDNIEVAIESNYREEDWNL
ncbi:MAG: DNA/RNA non-specific endonuclease [Bacteroidia bacterium]|nr:DNA/RNA non-specific endonuclease [Bacteroidia bacterium]